jgi:hypothetical protein
MAKRRRSERKWIRRRVRRLEFLSEVRQRLEADITPYLTTIQTIHDQTGRGVGFWALARMIFPVVEAVSSVLYRTGKKQKERRPVRLLRQLGFEYPNLVWEMYRHTLMHTDEMASASYMGRRVNWGIAVGNGHLWDEGTGYLQVDVKELFADFLEFLKRMESDRRSATKSLWVKESFRLNEAYNKNTRDEILRLGRR